MKKINLKILIVTSLVCLSTIILGVYFYNQLPENVAIHFDIQNNPDNYFPKPAFVFGMPVIMTFFQIFACVVNDLSDKHKEANKKASTVFKWLIPIVTVILYIVTISFALGNKLDIRKIVMLILGVMFIIMGNYLPKTKGSTYVHFGRKIKDEKLLNQASKISGYIMIINGILAMISTLFDPIISVALVIAIILEGIILTIYIYTKVEKKEEQ